MLERQEEEEELGCKLVFDILGTQAGDGLILFGGNNGCDVEIMVVMKRGVEGRMVRRPGNHPGKNNHFWNVLRAKARNELCQFLKNV